ncbi:bifunctional (p)ppGpp synthetase/guanosine-3',5'-bis(diphosphate) 3'-pyrophosphohydrolase, partial [bacterium]|nr:bifunctional (p)ppGpp synthetase/guanosine-3',5'-bis(diphosphate) 3'-pyrophosphohydrolase [bacterium]
GLRRFHLKPTSRELRDLAVRMGKSGLEQLQADIGQGVISVRKVIERLVSRDEIHQLEEKKENVFERFVSRARGSVKGVRVQGMDQFLIRFAQCCHPVPGDPIMGFITQGRGIVVHRTDCTNAAKLLEMPERNIEVSWDVDGEGAFLVQLRVLASRGKDFFRDVAESLAAMDTTIIKMDMKTENAIISITLILEVKNLLHLTKIMRRLYRIKGILSVSRDSENQRQPKSA